MQGVGFSSF